MKLEDISKENPFKVPDGYFDSLYDNIENKIKLEKKVVKFNFNKFIAVAASVIVMFLIFNPLKISETKVETQYTSNIYEDISEDDLIEYVSSSYSDYELYVELTK